MMLHIREEGGLVRQGFNIYPRKSLSRGFLLVIGRWRFSMRYSKPTGIFHCYCWREATCNETFEL